MSSRRERPKHQTPGTDSPLSAANVQPIERLGRPRAKNPLSTRSTSSEPVASLSQWRPRTADDDADDADDKVDENTNDEATQRSQTVYQRG